MGGYTIGNKIDILIQEKQDDLVLLEPVGNENLDDPNLRLESVEIVGLDFNDPDYCIVLYQNDPNGYLTFSIDESHVWNYNVNNKFIGCQGMVVNRKNLFIPFAVPVEQIRSREPGGCFCKLCKRKSEYSQPNQNDGSFVCYGCRSTKQWMLK